MRQFGNIVKSHKNIDWGTIKWLTEGNTNLWIVWSGLAWRRHCLWKNERWFAINNNRQEVWNEWLLRAFNSKSKIVCTICKLRKVSTSLHKKVSLVGSSLRINETKKPLHIHQDNNTSMHRNEPKGNLDRLMQKRQMTKIEKAFVEWQHRFDIQGRKFD